MHQCKTAHKIYKNDVFFGYLLGSIHRHINPTDFDGLQKKLKVLIDSVDSVFIECALPHYTTLQYGTERAILANLEEFKAAQTLHFFESLLFQQAMLNSSVWFGLRIVRLPWFNYSFLNRAPRLLLMCSKITQLALRVYNTFYNAFTANSHSAAVQRFAVEQHAVLVKIIENYNQGNIQELNEFDAKGALLKPRNLNKLNLILHNISMGKKSLYVVGAGHLPGESGLVKLLEREGYSLEPLEMLL